MHINAFVAGVIQLYAANASSYIQEVDRTVILINFSTVVSLRLMRLHALHFYDTRGNSSGDKHQAHRSNHPFR